jgi:ATP-dependent Clp protease ATP-binding subunit ClpA
MFERFTNRARHVVVLAQEEARQLNHNYIGTEHLLLGLLGEPDSIAGRALQSVGITLQRARDEVTAIVKRGKSTPSGHIPFTPRAKKTLELALREALQLHHNYIGTEHILLGLIREGEGVAAKAMAKMTSGDLLAIRMAILDLLPATIGEVSLPRRWLRRGLGALGAGESRPEGESAEQSAALDATPAADATLTEAARLAGTRPVGSHHLLLAALADADTAAARALLTLGIDLDQAREALRSADVTGTSDEPPEEAGRRQMVITVTDEKLTLEAADPVIIAAAQAALNSLGDEIKADGAIPGDLPACASLTRVWQALQDSLTAIQRRQSAAASPSAAPDMPTGQTGQ